MQACFSTRSILYLLHNQTLIDVVGLQGDTSYAHAALLQMHAAVAGLGPAFKIKLTLQNTGTSIVRHLPVVRPWGFWCCSMRTHAGMSACDSCWKPLSHQLPLQLI